MNNYNVSVYATEEDVKNGRMIVEITSRYMHIQQTSQYLKEIYIPEVMMSPPNYREWKIMENVKAEYSYTHEIEYWPGPKKMSDMRSWVEEMRIPCSNINRVWFFKTEEDMLLFMMVWG